MNLRATMKYGEATYVGSMRQNAYTMPGPIHRPRSFTRGTPQTIESLEAAVWCAEKPFMEFEWTVRGRLVKQLTREYESPEAMLNDYGYRAKQRFAKAFGIKANQSEEELEQELETEVEELQRQMESL